MFILQLEQPADSYASLGGLVLQYYVYRSDW